MAANTGHTDDLHETDSDGLKADNINLKQLSPPSSTSSSHHDLHSLWDHSTTSTSTDVQELLSRHIAQGALGWRPVSQRRLDLESARPMWLRECLAEATGVFLFVFPGIASVAALTLRMHEDPNTAASFGSMFQVGCAFGIGVACAVICCAPVSGGHFNPAITLAMAFWQPFPWRKVPRYILSQIFGAFMAGLALMALYRTQIREMEAALVADGKPLVGAGSPASILCGFPNNDQNNMLFTFMIEFLVDACLGVIIWAALDPSNPFVAPSSIPLVLGVAYAHMIWGFGGVTLSTNLARDLGTRLVAAMFYGHEAFTYKGYAPIGILVNIPATLLATAYYELVMRDSLRVIAGGHACHKDGDAGMYRYMQKAGWVDVEKAMGSAPEVAHCK